MSNIKVDTHNGTSPCSKSQGLVASCELTIFATKSSRRDQNRLVRQFEFVGLVTGTKVGPCDKILKQKLSVHSMRLVPATSRRD